MHICGAVSIFLYAAYMLDSSIAPAAHVLHMYMMSAVRQHECVQHAYNIFVRGMMLNVKKSRMKYPRLYHLLSLLIYMDFTS